MPSVIVKDLIQGYLFSWQELGISILVSRIVVHKSDGRVTGEIVVQSINDAGDMINIFPPTQFNFSSDRTRVSLAKNLSIKYKQFPWGEILDQLCDGVQERARRGEPVRELWTDAEDIKPPEPFLEPILYRNIPTVIFGDKEAAKSTLALYLYFCLLLPWRDNPLELKVPERSVKTLILDWEAEGEIVQYFGKRIQQGENLPALSILHRRCHLPLADDLERIHYWVEDTKAEMLIIDSLGAACGGELNKPEPALKFFSALRELKKGSLIIAQNAKDPETKKKSIFGCYSADTEVLTDTGWKKHYEIEDGDKIICYDPIAKCLRQDPFIRRWAYNYDGEMIHIKHKATEALITPTHKILTTNHGEIIAERLGHFINPAYKLPYNPSLKPRGKHRGRRQVRFQLKPGEKWLRLEPFLKFIGYWVSEGHIEGNKANAGLTQAVGSTLTDMKATLEQLGFQYFDIVRPHQDGWKECHTLRIRFDAGERGRHNRYQRNINNKFGRNSGKTHLLVDWLKRNCGEGAANKHLPALVWGLPRRQQRIVFDALIAGDGHLYEQGYRSYTTISNQLADEMQRLALLIGFGSQLTHRQRGNSLEQFELLISKEARRTITVSRKNIESVPYKGKVYCLTVPTGYYVTRYNGRVAILGNSVFFQYYTRNIFELVKAEGTELDSADIALFHRATNIGEHHKPMSFQLHYNETGITIARQAFDTQEFIHKVSNTAKVLATLQHGALSVDEIAKECDLKRSVVQVILTRLKARGQVLPTEGKGMWGLRTKEEE